MTDFAVLKDSHYHRLSWEPLRPPEQQRDVLLSDIVLHLPVLEYFASLCNHVTEFGVRDGSSTVAFLAGCRGKLVSYDIVRSAFVDKVATIRLPCSWEFVQRSSLDNLLVIEPTDFLFIDTLHNYNQLSRELTMHGQQARKYLGFHDTYTCGERDVTGPDPQAEGLNRAILEFLAKYPGEYCLVYETTACNGLTIYQRLSEWPALMRAVATTISHTVNQTGVWRRYDGVAVVANSKIKKWQVALPQRDWVLCSSLERAVEIAIGYCFNLPEGTRLADIY